jgi:hypothetical protein
MNQTMGASYCYMAFGPLPVISAEGLGGRIRSILDSERNMKFLGSMDEIKFIGESCGAYAIIDEQCHMYTDSGNLVHYLMSTDIANLIQLKYVKVNDQVGTVELIGEMSADLVQKITDDPELNYFASSAPEYMRSMIRE